MGNWMKKYRMVDEILFVVELELLMEGLAGD